MPPKSGRGRGRGKGRGISLGKYKTKRKIEIVMESSESDSTEKKRQRTGSPGLETEQEMHQEPQKTEQQASTPPLHVTDSRQSDSSSNENGDGAVDINPSTIKANTKPKIGKGKGKKCKQPEEPIVQRSFTEEEKQEIAKWLETKKLLYDIKNKDYKQKALKRQLWETKAAEYGVNYVAIQKWYQTQRTRFSKLREGQPKHQSTKRSGDGFSSGDDEDPVSQGEVSENDSDRDKFIRRIFAFLRPHIKRHKKDTPASFKDKLALAETGELAGSDDSTTGIPELESKQPSTKYSGYPIPRQPSRSRNSKEDQPETPIVGISASGPSHELQNKLVEFITKDQPINRSTPFCKYLETELDSLHDACLDPAYEEITTVLNHYRKVSRRYKTREAAGNKVGPSEDVPSAFQSQENTPQQRPIATYQRVNQIQQDSGIPCNSFYSTSRPSSPSPEFQPSPRQWPMNPPPGSVWQSQDCGYMEQANRQYNQEQFQTHQPATNASASQNISEN